MPSPQENSASPAAQTSPPIDLSGLRTRPVLAPESTLQTVKRNLTPELDTSRSSLGSEHQFDSGDSPQQQGEAEYKSAFGSPLERIHGHIKKFLSENEQHLSESVLKPFRAGLDSMANELEEAASSGHTQSGGQLNPVTRGLVGAAGAGLRAVPVGSSVKETAEALIVPPELPEGRGLSQELKAGEKIADLTGLRVKEISPPTTAGKSATKELPPQPRLPDTGTHAAIKTDDGSIYHDAAPEKQRTHIMLAKDLGIPPERVVSGGWLKDGEYEGSERSDAGKWGAQARAKASVKEKREARGSQSENPSLYTPEGAQPLAEKLGAKVVGSVAKKGATPGDLDLRIEGNYKEDETNSKMKAAGFEPRGSTVVSPKEAQASGKPYGKPGWKRAEHFQNAAGEKIDVWHDELEQSKEPPPLSPEKAAALERSRSLNLKHVGDPLPEMDPNDARNWIGYDGKQKTLKVYRGVDAEGRTVEPGDYVTTSKESAGGYGPHVVEMDVPASDLRYVQGHKNGDPNRVGQGGQVELLYAPKKQVKSGPQSEPKIPLHEKLFSEALAGLGPEAEKAAPKTTLKNASGESSASLEAQSRLKSEKNQGIKRFVIDTRSGAERPLAPTTDAVDVKPRPYEVIVQRGPQGETLLDSGAKARQYRPKRH